MKNQVLGIVLSVVGVCCITPIASNRVSEIETSLKDQSMLISLLKSSNSKSKVPIMEHSLGQQEQSQGIHKVQSRASDDRITSICDIRLTGRDVQDSTNEAMNAIVEGFNIAEDAVEGLQSDSYASYNLQDYESIETIQTIDESYDVIDGDVDTVEGDIKCWQMMHLENQAQTIDGADFIDDGADGSDCRELYVSKDEFLPPTTEEVTDDKSEVYYPTYPEYYPQEDSQTQNLEPTADQQILMLFYHSILEQNQYLNIVLQHGSVLSTSTYNIARNVHKNISAVRTKLRKVLSEIIGRIGISAVRNIRPSYYLKAKFLRQNGTVYDESVRAFVVMGDTYKLMSSFLDISNSATCLQRRAEQ